MFISRAPLRISLGGGGTDLPSFYENDEPGFLLAASINKYVFVSAHRNFDPSFILKYSEIENTDDIKKIRHPLIREALLSNWLPSSFLEISSHADIPAGTGLGSSGTFAVALLKVLDSIGGSMRTNKEIAEEACRLEIEVLREPSGKQDQFASALGGLTEYQFFANGEVGFRRLDISVEQSWDFEQSLLLFFTGIRREAREELAAMNPVDDQNKEDIRLNLDRVRKLGRETVFRIEKGDHMDVGPLFLEQWNSKLERSPSKVHLEINSVIQKVVDSGVATGGKLIGAGGGGFILFQTMKPSSLRRFVSESFGLREVPFSFDHEGAKNVSLE